MSSLLREFRLSAPAPSERRRRGSAFAVHQPGALHPPYRASAIAPAGRSTRATPPLRAPDSAATPRLHLKPGEHGTKELPAHCADGLICVRSRYDAQRGKRVTTVELLVAERDWDRNRLAPPTTASSRWASPLPT